MKRNSSSMLQMAFLETLSHTDPEAYAQIVGNQQSELNGMAYFYDVHFNDALGNAMEGVLVEVEAFGLPDMYDRNTNHSVNATRNMDTNHFYGMHIHEIGDCTPPFDKTGEHYNPENVLHPNHAGDLPPLIGNDGYAYTIFFTNRFRIDEILDRSLIIHSRPDDFTTQPSGNSGTKIGCGIIRPTNNMIQPR